jgi:DNA-binding transcriptional LysR family regulator
MELRHLRYFAVVAEEQHFGRASQRLFVAQPALSRQIQEIEGELGVTLFDRIGRNVRLTEAGRTFLQEAQGVLAQVERATRRAQQAARGQIGSLRIGFVPSMAQTRLVPQMFAQFRSTYPEIDLELRVEFSDSQLDALRKRQISLGFLYFFPFDRPGFNRNPS